MTSGVREEIACYPTLSHDSGRSCDLAHHYDLHSYSADEVESVEACFHSHPYHRERQTHQNNPCQAPSRAPRRQLLVPDRQSLMVIGLRIGPSAPIPRSFAYCLRWFVVRWFILISVANGSSLNNERRPPSPSGGGVSRPKISDLTSHPHSGNTMMS